MTKNARNAAVGAVADDDCYVDGISVFRQDYHRPYNTIITQHHTFMYFCVYVCVFGINLSLMLVKSLGVGRISSFLVND